MSDEQKDPINPSHYRAYKGLEVIQLTEQMNFNRGNAVKYTCRAGLKDPSKEIEDLEKAVWYLQREIDRLNGGLKSGSEMFNIGKNTPSTEKFLEGLSKSIDFNRIASPEINPPVVKLHYGDFAKSLRKTNDSAMKINPYMEENNE